MLAQPFEILETLAKVPNLMEPQFPFAKKEENCFSLKRSP